MKPNDLLPLLVLIGLLSQCTPTYQSSLNTDQSDRYKVEESEFKPGRCYAKSLIPNQYEEIVEEYFVYTGDESEEGIEVEKLQIETKAAGERWVKKKVIGNCRNLDGTNDCITWKLEDIPADTIELKVLKDTSQTMDYEIQSVMIEKLVRKGGDWEWREVLCNAQITPQLLGRLRGALYELGYYNKEIPPTAAMDKDTRSALEAFQTDRRVPVGNFDLQTMDLLGIAY